MSRQIASKVCGHCYSTSSMATATTPPILLKIRKDMKAAMQAKDSNRLSVLRSLMSQAINASKTSLPIVTDVQMLAMIRKTANASRIASAEFKTAGRQDLVDKEENQLKIMNEYAGAVETVDRDEIVQAVNIVMKNLRIEGGNTQLGEVLRRTFAPEALGTKLVDRREVAQIVKQILDAA